VEFHVHIDASLLVVGVILSHNVIGKSDQPIVYVFRLLNIVEQNYNIIKKGFSNGFFLTQVETLFARQ
jgi:hypothetical protein